MGRRDIRAAHQSSLVPAGNGEQKIRDLNAAKGIVGAGGGTLSRGEIAEVMEIFTQEAQNPNNDAEVRAWISDTTGTISALKDHHVPRLLERVKTEGPQLAKLFDQMMDESRTTPSLSAMILENVGAVGDLDPSAQTVPAAVKKLLNQAKANGAESYDVRELEPDRLSVERPGSDLHLSPKGIWQRYPQDRPMENVLAVSRELTKRNGEGSFDGLDPRATLVNGEIIDRMATQPQKFREEIKEGGQIKLVDRTETWADYATEKGGSTAIAMNYDTDAHPDPTAWGKNQGPFSGHWMAMMDGSFHLMRMPRRSYVEDEMGMAGGVLTTGALARGFPSFGHGHIDGQVREVPKDPNDPNSEMIKTVVITKLTLSGRITNALAEGKIKLPNLVELMKANGMRVADNMQIGFDNAAGRNVWLNPDTNVLEQRP